MRYRKDFLIAGCYTLLTLLLTYPVPAQLTSHIAGFPGEDNLQWRWFLWWFKHSILVLQTSVSNVSLLYAPLEGQQPLYLITSFIPALALPITLLGGPTLSFNLTFLLSFALSAYTTYLLAYYLVRHRPAAFIAGLIFGFYPARFGYAIGHLSFASLFAGSFYVGPSPHPPASDLGGFGINRIVLNLALACGLWRGHCYHYFFAISTARLVSPARNPPPN